MYGVAVQFLIETVKQAVLFVNIKISTSKLKTENGTS